MIQGRNGNDFKLRITNFDSTNETSKIIFPEVSNQKQNQRQNDKNIDFQEFTQKSTTSTFDLVGIEPMETTANEGRELNFCVGLRVW